METSKNIAQIFAVIYLAVAAGMLLSRPFYERMIDDFKKNSFNIYIGGAMSLLVGFLIVKYHNHWVGSWTVVVTIIGWMAVVKGVCLLVFPDQFVNLVTKQFSLRFGWIFALVAGLFFGYFGFFG
ncbi:MAG: hypothetical protein HKN23_13890 [Verrucomicrobiales bacterium]|nr:hypothetical protein [Verrucomicrobiales bacterium]